MSEFTDLSKPLEIYDQAKYDAAIRTIINILFFNSMDAVEPVVASVPDPCLNSSINSQSRNNSEVSHDPQRAPAA